MNEPDLVRVLKSKCRLPHVLGRLPDCHRPLSPDHFFEGLSFDVLHGDVVRSIHFIGVEQDDDVGMVELGDRLRLAMEARQDLRPCSKNLWADHLQGDDPVEFRLEGLEDHAHAPLAEGSLNTVGADNQLLAIPGQQLCLLVGGQPAALNEFPAQLHGRNEASPIPVQPLGLTGGEELVSAEKRYQLVWREHLDPMRNACCLGASYNPEDSFFFGRVRKKGEV